MSIFFYLFLSETYAYKKKNIHVSSFQIKNESFDKSPPCKGEAVRDKSTQRSGEAAFGNVALVGLGLLLSMISTLFVRWWWR